MLFVGNVYCDFLFNFLDFKYENKYCIVIDLNIWVFCLFILLNNIFYILILCLFGINFVDEILLEVFFIFFFEWE